MVEGAFAALLLQNPNIVIALTGAGLFVHAVAGGEALGLLGREVGDAIRELPPKIK